jgi:hypothetical protein
VHLLVDAKEAVGVGWLMREVASAFAPAGLDRARKPGRRWNRRRNHQYKRSRTVALLPPENRLVNDVLEERIARLA